jgi:hypothetical protein
MIIYNFRCFQQLLVLELENDGHFAQCQMAVSRYSTVTNLTFQNCKKKKLLMNCIEQNINIFDSLNGQMFEYYVL